MNPRLDTVLQELADLGWTFDLLKQLTPEDIGQLPVPDGPEKPSTLLIIKAAIAKAKAEEEIEEGPRKRRKQREEKEQTRKHYVSEVLASIKRTAPEAANEVQEMFQRLISAGSDLEVCIVVDATESMAEHVERVKLFIERVAQTLTERAGMTARFALVAYRDYGDRLRHEVFGFGDSAALCRNLNSLKVEGGGDTCEDCFGGLWKATNLPWAAPARVILWLGDAPQHGKQYNGGEDDSFPEGDLEGMTSDKIFYELRQKGIILVFGELKSKTDAMIAQLKREVALFGSNLFLTYNCDTDMSDFLTNALHTTVSLTRADMHERHGRGQEKPLTLVRLNWDFSPQLWGDEEEGNVYTFEAYSGGDLHPLYDLMFDGPNTLERQVSLRMTRNPVERGEQRFAFYVLVTEGRDWIFWKRMKKGMTKISRYEGSHNSKAALVNQAHIQEVARFLGQEFTLQLAKHSRKEKVIYVPVELLRIPGRTTGDNFYSLEPFIPGNYVKFNNNNGFVDKALEALHPLMQTFSHFTYSYSKGLVTVTDVQGVVEQGGIYTLTDPAVHTADPTCLQDPTNLGREGMATFFKTHTCNDVCRLLALELPENLNVGVPIEPHVGVTDPRAAEADRESLYPSL